MDHIGIITFIIILANIAVSYQGLKSDDFLDKYSFEVDELLIRKDYKRLLTSGFLHVSWVHLLFNMLSLFLFGADLERSLGPAMFLLLYMCSLVGGNLFALYIHRNHGDYSCVGASGAITGIVFAAIAYYPGMQIGMIVIPVYVPAWLYGLLYVLYTIYGIKEQHDHIGHEAHLGGGLTGLILIVLLYPATLLINSLAIALIFIPCVVFLYLIVSRPAFMLLERPFGSQKPKPYDLTEEKYYSSKRNKERELDELLDKINENGIQSLTKKEKEKLEELSK